VFTARYALSPYIKQIHFVFKGLNCIQQRRVFIEVDVRRSTLSVRRRKEEKTSQSELNRTVLLPEKIYDHSDGENEFWNQQVVPEL
jgi:hypothetical protein